ncbi:iron-siderophore ABC transporter substrate-binding protein [Desertifilum sp. FACHB-1129]|uniref:Amino acid ABC transporter substrate-binding protein n=1 Tax=Desertifilum tharense IPPAS B-1220 TaxID=1781255 RepID=A0A1E5QKJ0_9CYAN|nr:MULTISPECIES: iron-siderophore ABC transporter substrate-binding protein [Desertifilum]MDA0211096.1 iron-siderophore ABC transporter substrate-binding protein [Cyanobacteria bacterium FC1]MBD2314168.1 iron-siderophore ABC transporter substrate-binding protein [Desertifilum sp. FACHB-1129]MBD2320133.1 iron-siderophore ABC transporter substrate-binding protein [Desertifilum sp. FACHB-866]MBD2330261.1 iron-siderophore ABC transporter substrate-binding protein [Desertifilum sp. FACHB-868]OEJ751
MTRRELRWLLLTGLMLLTCWQTIACARVDNAGSQTDCYVVEHAAGVTCVPNTIQRLVTLDIASLENAIALGVQPVGGTLSERVPAHLHRTLGETANVGAAGEPNLEQILAVKPDFIIGLGHHQAIYPQLSRIAPTVLVNFEHSGQWKEVFHQFSQVLNREAIAQQIMSEYRDRASALHEAIEAASSSQGLPFPPQVSVVRIYPDSINLYLRDSFVGTILQDAGLARPEAQNISASDAQQRFGNPIQVSISLERLEKADGDVLFVWTGEDTSQASQAARENLNRLKANPLWQQLKAMQTQRVYLVPDYWIGWGPIIAKATIDDLLKYLVEQKPKNSV